MTASVLQEIATDSIAAGANISVAFGSNNTAGSAIHAVATWSAAVTDFTSVTDSRNTYGAVLDALNDAGNGQQMGHAIAVNIGAGANTVQANFTNTPAARGLIIREIGGVSAAPNDGHNGQFQLNVGNGTDAVSSLTATNTNQPVLMSGACMDNGAAATPAAGTGFTSGLSGWSFGGTDSMRAESERFTTTSSKDAKFTAGAAGSDTMTVMAMFDEASGASSGGTPVGPFHIGKPSSGPELRRMALPQKYPDVFPTGIGETTPIWVGGALSDLVGVARRRLPQQYPDTIIPPPSPGGPIVGRTARGPGGMGPARRRQIPQLFADFILSTIIAAVTGSVVIAGEVPSLTTTLQPTEASIVISGNAPSITTILQASEGQVVIGGNAPSLTEKLQPSEGSVVIGGNAPSLTEQLLGVVGAVIIDGNAPAVSQTGAGVNPTEAPLIIGGNAPDLLLALSPTEGNLSIDGGVPDLGIPAEPGPGGSGATHPRRIVYERADRRKPATFIDKIGEPVGLLEEALAPETVPSIVRAELDTTVVRAAMKAQLPKPALHTPLVLPSPAPEDDEDDLLLLS